MPGAGTEAEPTRLKLWLDTSPTRTGATAEASSARGPLVAHLRWLMPQTSSGLCRTAKAPVPSKLQEVRWSCSCPDKGRPPAKHVSAVLLLMGDRLSEEPLRALPDCGRKPQPALADRLAAPPNCCVIHAANAKTAGQTCCQRQRPNRSRSQGRSKAEQGSPSPGAR